MNLSETIDESKPIESVSDKTEQKTKGFINIDELELFLEKEKQRNKKDAWNKLSKTTKLQKLHHYAENYGKEKNYSVKEIKQLKAFFKTALDKGKLQKNKDVEYNKETSIIETVNGLIFNTSTNQYTLRNLDRKVSTLKSLTPISTDRT